MKLGGQTSDGKARWGCGMVENGDGTAGKKAGGSVQATVRSYVTFATHENNVALLVELAVENATPEPVEDLTLHIDAAPEFLKSRTWTLDRISADGRLVLRDRAVLLDRGFLWALTEATRGQVTLTLSKAGGEVVTTITHPVRLLAHNEWGGIQHMPELLGAFVLPNDPAVEQINRLASDALEAAGRPRSLNGYGAGSRERVWEMVSGIWTAVSGLRLDYALPPASFERVGQKIRTPSQILEARRATCLDLTLLFAACFENAGLHPFVVLTQGHSFPGVWLAPKEFASVATDDGAALRKGLTLKDLIVFESTLVSERPGHRFAEALRRGENQLSEDAECPFELVVDVKRSRMQQITPLPLTGSDLPGGEAADGEGDVVTAAPIETAPAMDGFDQPAESTRDETPQGRLARWRSRLLDLSLRNRLLNFKTQSSSVILQCADPAQFEDRLSDGIEFRFTPVQDNADRDDDLYQQKEGQRISADYAQAAFERDELLVDLDAEALDKRLVALYRQTKRDNEEGGAHTLFVAIGFLAWKKTPTDEVRYEAPLLLIPVSLKRRGVGSRMALTIHEDEPRLNPTLCEMLRQDFEIELGLSDDDLPTDESGLNVPLIWQRVTQAVETLAGFEVIPKVVLATFTFAKYLMWKDLSDRLDLLKENRFVQHLVDTPREPYGHRVDVPGERDLDQTCPPEALYTPLPADSSQLKAVVASDKGQDFVLVGPPGTGKSQTITNMIAHALAHGRTVLFVAEKTAALDVVYHRLRNIGLGAFCLELHSNKAKKTHVLEQLRDAMDHHGHPVSAQEWQSVAEQLGAQRATLNALVERLHAPYANGLSAYQAFGQVVAGKDKFAPTLSIDGVLEQETHTLSQLRSLVGELRDRRKALPPETNIPQGLLGDREWSPSWAREISAAARQLRDAAHSLTTAHGDLVSKLGLAAPVSSRRQMLTALPNLVALLPRAHDVDLCFLFRADPSQLTTDLQYAREMTTRFGEAARRLSARYHPHTPFRRDLDILEDLIDDCRSTWWPRSFFLKQKVTKTLRRYTKTKIRRPFQDVHCLKAMRGARQALDRSSGLREHLGGMWQDLKSDFNGMERSIQLAEGVTSATIALADTPEAMERFKSDIRKLTADKGALLHPEGMLVQTCTAYLYAAKQFEEKEKAFVELSGATAEDRGDAEPWIEKLTTDLDQLIAHEADLRAWSDWLRIRRDVATKGLDGFAEGLETGAIAPDDIETVFDLAHARDFADAILDQDKLLREFSGDVHETRIQNFIRMDDQFAKLTEAVIAARLSGAMPSADDSNRRSEMGVLNHELNKQKRHIPIRKLIEQMPTVFPKLAPCIMMSPLSVAQYLPPGQALFDLVIFDEASQISVWDAIGAVARGRQTVIVGDPKQMPPSNFFGRTQEAEDSSAVDEDMESILDEACAAQLPNHDLRWHYRSRRENLIAFSNHTYYAGKLITFPSPETPDQSVAFRHVPQGIYGRGRAKTNPIEARAVVNEVLERLLDPLRREHSIGIVTFNIQQRDLIENLLDKEQSENPDLERIFADRVTEPVMVKNIENVQGDERDVILFSATFGKDLTGAMSMHFGELNKANGQKRMNVAITRARWEMVVFCSFLPEEIDLARTSAEGVRDFKTFLEFARRGPQAIAEADSGSLGSYESPFEEAVAEALRRKGWTVRTQIGVSSFRIDLAIVDPDRPGRFLAGIECDGATYHRAATARDRDKIREAVLRGLGWEILRVWSTDWWAQADRQVERLDSTLRALLEQSRAKRAAENLVEQTPVEKGRETNPAVTPDDGATMPPAENDDDEGVSEEDEKKVPAKSECPEQLVPTDVENRDDPTYGQDLNPETFSTPGYARKLRVLIEKILEAEGPMREDILAKRVARAHGWQRTGNQIIDRVSKVARRHCTVEGEGDSADVFVFPVGFDLNAMVFRKPDGDERRAIEEISMAELVALRRMLPSDLSCEEAVEAMKGELGVQRLAHRARKRLEEAHRKAKKSRLLAEDLV